LSTRFPRRRVAADGVEMPEMTTVSIPPARRNQLEVGSVEGTKSRLVKNEVALIHDEGSVKGRRLACFVQ
jgi:hypothetical protein